MKKAISLLACLLCVGVVACKPQHAARNMMREQRIEQRGDRDHRGGGLRRACRNDIEQYCAADQRGRDRRECLQSHMDKLSADCKTALQNRMDRRGGGRRNRDFNGNTTNTNDDDN